MDSFIEKQPQVAFHQPPCPSLQAPMEWAVKERERKMIGSSWCPEVSLLLFFLAEGSQEDTGGLGV